MRYFADREHAGRLLGEALVVLGPAPGPASLVLGIPRGGVIVAAAVARVLGAELDVSVPAKVRAPQEPELAIGAVAPDGEAWLDLPAVRRLGIGMKVLGQQVAAARQEVLRRTAAFRGHRPPPEITGRCVVLVDDGVATGATMVASARSVRARGPSRLVIAVPIAPIASVRSLGDECDQVVCLASPEPFLAVGQGYVDFQQVGDDAVRSALAGTGRQP